MTDNEEVNRIVKEYFTNEFCAGYVEVGDEGTFMPKYYKNFEESIENFSVNDDDIFMVSYPKTGTTWTQEMVWLIANDLDFKRAEAPLDVRYPFMELCTLYDFDTLEANMPDSKIPEFVKNSLEFARKQERPRFLKTHMPYCLLPKDIRDGIKKPKMIYTFRNPKDVCVSYFHHGLILQGWTPNINDFCKAFMAEKIMYGSYWKHVLGFWNQRDSQNLLCIAYEDMKKDLKSVIRRVAKFLNKDLTDDQVKSLLKHLDFNSMKNNSAVNKQDYVDDRRRKNLAFGNDNFMRSGTVGKHKEELTPEIIETLDTYTKKYVCGTSFEKEYGYIL